MLPARQTTYQVTPTKYQWVFGDPDNGFQRRRVGRATGFNLEGSYGLFKRRRSNKKIAIGFGLQDTTAPQDTSFYAHLEFPALGILQLFGTIFRHNLDGMGDVFAGDMFTSPDTIVLTGLRLQVLPVMFFNVHYNRTFRIVGSGGSEYNIGNATIFDQAGNPFALANTPLYDNVDTLLVEVEFGWEFDDDEEVDFDGEG